jgi:hypothetical protein
MPATNASTSHFDARQAHGALLYEESDIPRDMTIAQWRRSRVSTVASSDRPGFMRRLPRTLLRTTA